jgi:hypothetical protein
MNVRVNAAMLELLGGDPEYYETSALTIPDSLRKQVELGFKEVEGCVVPAFFVPSSIWSEARPRVDNIDDETGLECLLSSVHLDGLVPDDTALTELARLGLDFAFVLRGVLLDSQIAGPFAIIISAQEPDPELNVGPTCTVRFHRIRVGQVWAADNLESYQEAVAVCDFDTLPPATSAFA